ncbi:MAG: hypothetical protein ACE5GN_01205 [Waddliaceae bacterium]
MFYNFATIPFFRPLLKIFFLSSLLLLMCGCAPYRVCTHRFLRNSPDQGGNQKNALSHGLYQVVPRHRCQIKGYDVGHWFTWVLFGNDDDGIFGESSHKPYRPNRKNNVNKAIAWWFRNPLHNFTFYAIGSAHRTNSEFALLNVNRRGVFAFHYDPISKNNFGGSGTSFFFALHGGKPYISLRLKYANNLFGEFYLGWRQRGNFGIKCHPLKKKR